MSPRPAAATFDDAAEIGHAREAVGYLPDHGIATAAFVASRLRRPLLVEESASPSWRKRSPRSSASM